MEPREPQDGPIRPKGRPRWPRLHRCFNIGKLREALSKATDKKGLREARLRTNWLQDIHGIIPNAPKKHQRSAMTGQSRPKMAHHSPKETRRGPKTGPRRARTATGAPSLAQGGPKIAHNSPKVTPRGARMAPGRAKIATRGPQDAQRWV